MSSGNANANDVNIKDGWMFLFLYPLMGVSFVHIGNDNAFTKLIRIPSYYTDIFLALAVVYLTGFYIRWLSGRIDKRYDTETHTKTRLLHQFIWGLLLPAIFSIVVEIVYLWLLGIPLRDSSIFYLELPVIIVFLLIINLLYFLLYIRAHTTALRLALEQRETGPAPLQERYVIAKQGTQNIRVPESSIAYFILKEKLTFLVTTENRHLVFDKPMKDIMDTLPEEQFYRLNRQLIASRNSIVKFTPTKTRRLEIELDPPLEEEVFLPKAKASQFMSWLNQS